MKTRSFLSIFAFVIHVNSVFAARIIDLEPIYTSSIHGGVIGNQVCYSANMFPPGTYTDGGVKQAWHLATLHFENVGSVDQKVKVVLKQGSGVTGSNGNNGTTTVSLSPFELSADHISEVIDIPSGGYGYYNLRAYCNHVDCGFADDGDIEGSNFENNGAAGALRVCYGLGSTFRIRLIVEDSNGGEQGAIRARINVVAHRRNGWVDHVFSGTGVFPVMGGQAF